MNPTEPSFAQSQQIDALPVPNLPLLRKVLDHIDAHPEEHNQAIWGFEYSWGGSAETLQLANVKAGRCGTAMCIAGWSMFLGAPELFDEGMWGADDAVQVLGLTAFEGVQLFYASNTRCGIQSVAEGIAARAGERL